MNHEYYEDLISARIDGLLTEEEEAELNEHLASCPDCRRAWREMDTVHHLLRGASPLPPEGLEDRILEALPAQPKRRSPWMRKAAPLAAAAVFLLAVVGITKTVANFHSTVGEDVVQAEAVQAEEETEEAAGSAKTEGAAEDKDSMGAFGKDKEETEEAADAETEAGGKTGSAAPSQGRDKAQTASQSKDKKTDTAKSDSKRTDTAKSDSKKADTAKNSQAKPAASEAKPAAQETKPAAGEAEPAAAQAAEDKAETAGGGGASEAARTEAAAEEAPAEEAPAQAEAPAAPEPEPETGTTTAAQAAAEPEPEDEDPEAPAASTITWQQARDRLDAYLDGPQDDLTAQGMDRAGTHWLFTTGGKQYAVDIHTGAVSQR